MRELLTTPESGKKTLQNEKCLFKMEGFFSLGLSGIRWPDQGDGNAAGIYALNPLLTIMTGRAGSGPAILNFFKIRTRRNSLSQV
jgi:hypothetical protein